jgi:hypothetical protein
MHLSEFTSPCVSPIFFKLSFRPSKFGKAPAVKYRMYGMSNAGINWASFAKSEDQPLHTISS